MTGAPIVTLDHVAIGYGRNTILADLNLTIFQGSFTGVLGPNGSGKSSLLKTVLGIYPPLRGTIVIHPVGGRPPMLGYVPQRESLDPVYLLSAFEVVLMGVCGRVGAGRRISSQERDWARQCLGQTGAGDLGRKLFSELSGGQKQRVLLARALAAKPDLLMLDEPISGIDLSASRAIMDLLRQLHQEQHQTIVMVSHDLSAIRQYAQNVAWLHQGEVSHGPVAELLNHDRIEQIFDAAMG